MLFCIFATHVGPIIGGIIGVILVLSLVIALCAAVIGVIYYRRRMAHKRMKLSHAVHCGEYNTILDWLKCYDH